jgi:hypothetical protein
MYKSSQIYPKSKANLTGFTEGFDFFSRRWWSNVFFFPIGLAGGASSQARRSDGHFDVGRCWAVSSHGELG